MVQDATTFSVTKLRHQIGTKLSAGPCFSPKAPFIRLSTTFSEKYFEQHMLTRYDTFGKKGIVMMTAVKHPDNVLELWHT